MADKPHLKTMQAQEAERLRDYESEHRSAQVVGATVRKCVVCYAIYLIDNGHACPKQTAAINKQLVKTSEILEIALRNIAYNTGLSRHDMIKYAAEQLALYNKMMGERG